VLDFIYDEVRDELVLLASGRCSRPLERLFRRRGTECAGYVNAEPARWRPIELDLADTVDDVREMAGVFVSGIRSVEP
jgi:hypothetical protein